jgi:MinD-like ATPase involved in chromosome partitioning or flagellar assembly
MSNRSGKIITFYSFKGGVGRTMALANVAFIAAMNGKRVLVMDWDLEAPGLAYYFRGLLDPQKDRALKDTKGLLNVLWQWKSTASEATRDEVQGAFQEFAEGSPFKDCSVSLVPNDRLPSGASLDYISAGSKYVDETNRVSYEDALAGFSWQEFFERFAGGAILESLRNWCKRNYDFILVDSRTGLADVAGICTMQLPDEVLMCFVLNRQNIDGTARVAQAIREKRGEQVRLRAIPMRTSREGTSEESDARARAIFELKRIGGFSADALQEDFNFAVRATEGVPFYETLSLLLPQTPAIEVFSANYRQLASEIVGNNLSLPVLDDEWADGVRRRLQPRHATAEYIASLRNFDPVRAAEELHRLLESALQDELDGGGLDDDYIDALIEAVLDIPVDLNPDSENAGTVEVALDLLRSAYRSDRTKWGPKLVELLEYHSSVDTYRLDSSQQIALYDEADDVLANSNTLAAQIHRVHLRRSVARIHHGEEQLDAAENTLSAAWQMLRTIRKEHALARHEVVEIGLIEADLHRLWAEGEQARKNYAAAIQSYLSGLEAIENSSLDVRRLEVARPVAQFHARLSFLYELTGDIEQAVASAVRTAEIAGKSFGVVGSYFVTAASPIISFGDPDVAVAFCAQALLQDKGRSLNAIVTHSGRVPRTAAQLITSIAALVRLLRSSADPQVPALVDSLSSIVKMSLEALPQRRVATHSGQQADLRAAAESFVVELAADEMTETQRQTWDDLLRGLDRMASRNFQAPE